MIRVALYKCLEFNWIRLAGRFGVGLGGRRDSSGQGLGLP
jgi:hypothetical protein